MFCRPCFSAAVILVFLAGSSRAALAQPPSDPLARARVVECAFTMLATGNWTSGVPKLELKPTALSVKFSEVNIDEGTAEQAGSSGSYDIIVRFSLGVLHFVQAFREGALYVTTVWPKATSAGRLQAVHTRHEYTPVSLPGYTSQPEQYYGDCVVR